MAHKTQALLTIRDFFAHSSLSSRTLTVVRRCAVIASMQPFELMWGMNSTGVVAVVVKGGRGA